MATDELPPYPQMIMEALDSLKQAEGSNKSSLSEYIESKYGELPADHANQLTTHLTRMKDTGELLLLLNNNYVKAGASAPPKRGRGRPPKKPKDPLAEPVMSGAAIPVGPPRPRGRPPSKDPNAPPAAKKLKSSAAGSTGRPRGRPRKVKHMENGVEA